MAKAYVQKLIAMSDAALNVELETITVKEFRQALKAALEEQDRDTRYACADAVLSCNEDMSGECIWKSEAHSACMNARAV